MSWFVLIYNTSLNSSSTCTFPPKVHSYHFSHLCISMSLWAILGKHHHLIIVEEVLRCQVYTLKRPNNPSNLGNIDLPIVLSRLQFVSIPTTPLLFCTHTKVSTFLCAHVVGFRGITCPLLPDRSPIYPYVPSKCAFLHPHFQTHSLTLPLLNVDSMPDSFPGVGITTVMQTLVNIQENTENTEKYKLLALLELILSLKSNSR